jgi:hypothetical protein
MAKIKKRKLSWVESSSSQIVGYKLYWSENGTLDYGSKCEMLGNVTEIILPGGVTSFKPNGGQVKFGVTAVDELGNESDMIALTAPYQFNVPKAPDELYLQNLDDYYISNVEHEESDEEEPLEPIDSMALDNHFKSKQSEDDIDILTKFQLITKRAQTL